MLEDVRILVVEDERKVANFIRQGLTEEGHSVEVAPDGATALDLLVEGPPPDLVVLDLMLPKVDGFAILKAARQRRVTTPVLILTARDSVADKVRGLDLGRRRLPDQAVRLRRIPGPRARAPAPWHRSPATPRLQLGDLTLDPATREVWRGSRRITLTTREYALLEYFLRNPGRVLTRPMLAEHVWGLDFDPESNIVDVYVGYLRRKVDGPDDQRLVHTVRGAGYVLKIDEP